MVLTKLFEPQLDNLGKIVNTTFIVFLPGAVADKLAEILVHLIVELLPVASPHLVDDVSLHTSLSLPNPPLLHKDHSSEQPGAQN